MKYLAPIDHIFSAAQKEKTSEQGIVWVTLDTEGNPNPGLFRKTVTYRVRPDVLSEITDLSVTIRDFLTDRNTDVKVRCRLSIDPTKTTQAAQFFHQRRNIHPDVVFRDALGTAFQDWWEETGQKISLPAEMAIAQNSAAISAYLRGQLRQHGFRLEFKLETRGIKPRPIELVSTRFAIRCMDNPSTEVMLRFSCEITPLEKPVSISKQRPTKPGDWVTLIANACKTAAKKSIPADMYYYRPTDLTDALIQAANAALKPHGMRIGWFSPETDKPAGPETKQYDITYEWRDLTPRNIIFTARVEAGVAPNGIARYIQADRPDLQSWLRDNLASATQAILFNKYFTDLSPNGLSQFQRELEEKMLSLAKGIGVSVRTLLATPNLPEWKYLSEFALELESDSSGRFETADPSFTAEMHIRVSGKVSNLSTIRRFISAPNDIKEQTLEKEMLEIIRQTIAQIMLSIGSEQYFLGFYDTSFGETTQYIGSTVESQIRMNLSSILKQRYDFEILSIHFRQVDSHVQSTVRAIKEMPDIELELSANPFDRDLEEEDSYPVQLTVSITAIDNSRIYLIAAKNQGPENISKWIRSQVQSFLDGIGMKEYELETRPKAIIDSTIDKSYTELHLKIQKLLNERAQQVFGISVNIIHFDVSESDAQQFRNRRNAENYQLQERMAKAMKERNEQNVDAYTKITEQKALVQKAIFESNQKQLEALNAKLLTAIQTESYEDIPSITEQIESLGKPDTENPLEQMETKLPKMYISESKKRKAIQNNNKNSMEKNTQQEIKHKNKKFDEGEIY